MSSSTHQPVPREETENDRSDDAHSLHGASQRCKTTCGMFGRKQENKLEDDPDMIPECLGDHCVGTVFTAQ